MDGITLPLSKREVTLLKSLGATNRYVPVTEIDTKGYLSEATRLAKRGLVDVVVVGEGSQKHAEYGLVQKGLDDMRRAISSNSSLEPRVDELLFGHTLIPIEKTTREQPSSQPTA